MGLFGNMYDKRKAKPTDTAAPFLHAGEVAGTTAICQSEKANQAVWGKNNCGPGRDWVTALDRSDRVVGCEKRSLRPR